MKHPFQAKLPQNAHTEKLLEPVRIAAEQYLETPMESLPFTLFRGFWETGDRTPYEACYIAHRRRMNVFTAMALHEEDEIWISSLEDCLWAVCDEFTWALPAHIYDREEAAPSVIETTVDLFAAETAFALSEIYALLKDRLSPLVRERVCLEIRRRVVGPYMEQNLTWAKNNWSAVCAGSVGSAMLLLGMEEEFERCKERLLTSMQLFLDSYLDDGCCLEGVLYWGYGFGYFCFFADLLRTYSHGAINLFANEKVRKIAAFRQKAYLNGDLILPFADAPHNLHYHIGINHFLAREYDEVTAPDIAYEAVLDDDIRYRFADFLRDFYWYDETLMAKEEPKESVAFWEESQWYVHKAGECAFACKGGTNDEPHNHNDVGSFILLDGRQFILDDFGWNEYYDGYFKEQRYDFLCTSSRGHSVPVINGQYQRAGAKYSATLLSHSETGCKFEFAAAYGAPGLKSLTREFSVGKDVITVTDTVCGEKIQVTERFITRIKPEVAGDAVQIGPYRLSCDVPAQITISSETFEPRRGICKTDMEPVETAYLIDFIVTADSEMQKLQVTIKK